MRWRSSNPAQDHNLTDEVHYTGGYNFQRSFPGDPRRVTLTVRVEL